MKYSRNINNNNNNNDNNNIDDVHAVVFNTQWPCVISKIQWAFENAFVPVTFHEIHSSCPDHRTSVILSFHQQMTLLHVHRYYTCSPLTDSPSVFLKLPVMWPCTHGRLWCRWPSGLGSHTCKSLSPALYLNSSHLPVACWCEGICNQAGRQKRAE